MKSDLKKQHAQPGFHAGQHVKLCRRVLPALIASCFACSPAWANPTGAQVVTGQVNISNNGNVLTVTNSPGSIINWQSFSINPGELTQFLQQSSSSAVLNRIVGQDPSQIFGALQSNGKVYLINPNGILFGAGSQVNVGGLVASSLNISNADFTAGKNNFASLTPTSSAGAVTNQGSIITPSGGQIYLIAPQVQNTGILTSPQGEVLLAAGHSVQLVDGGDPNIQVVVSAPTDQALNLGQVLADGGKIGIYGALVNQNGIVSADSAVVGQNGEIVFKSSQTTLLGGNSVTSAAGAGTGGNIYVLGPQVGLTDYATVNASGQTGGGTVLVGGDFHGANPTIMNANTVTLGANTSINADAIQNGNGGRIAVWSLDSTSVAGNISAKGGALSGNGGYVETSGAQLAIANGTNVTTVAPHGKLGSWLLDPDDFTIASSGGNVTGAQLSSDLTSNSVTIDTTGSPTTCVGTTCSVSGIPGSVNGDIWVSDIVSWGSGSTLTLNAGGSINVNSAITNTGAGTLALNAANSITQSAAISVPTLSAIATAGSVTLNQANSVNSISGSGATGFQFNNTAPGGTLTVAGITSTNSPITVTEGSTGGITVTGAINAGTGAIALATTAGGITNNAGAGLLSGSTLQVNSVGSVAIAGYNNFATLATSVTGTGNTINIEDSASDLTIGSVNGTVGLTAPGGIQVREYSNGGITVANNVTASAGDITLGVGSGSGGITVSSGATVSGNNIDTYTSGGPITVSGIITGSGTGMTLNSDGGAITVTGTVAGGSGSTVTLDSSSGSGDITTTGGSITSAGGSIVMNAGGGIAVGTVNAGTGSVSLSAYDGSITGGTVTGSQLTASSYEGSVSLTTNVSSLSIPIASGGVDITNIGALGISGITLYSSASPGNIHVSATGALSVSGDITNYNSGGGDVVLTAGTSGPYQLTVGSGIAISAAAITLNAGNAINSNLGTYPVATPVLNAYLYNASTTIDVTVTGETAGNKTYDGTTTATLTGGSLAGVASGDDVVLVQSGSFSSKNVGTGIGVTATDTLNIIGDTSGDTYVLIQPTGLSANITPAILTVSGQSAGNKIYNGNTAAILAGGSLSGVIAGDAVTLVNPNTGVFASKNVGTNIAVTASDSLSGADAGNYTLVQPALAANITPATLTLSGTQIANNKTYDGTTAATLSGGTLSGVIGNDSVTLIGSGSFASKNVGTNIPVTVQDVVGGADGGNYIIAQPTITLAANITPLPITVTATGSNKVYNGSVNDIVTLNGVGVVLGDNVSFTDTSASFANANVGTGKAVTVSGITATGADAGNYSVNGSAVTSANITPATLTVIGEIGQNKVYDGTTAATLVGGTLSGLISSDNGAVLLTQAGNFASSNVGNGIAITAADSLSGSAAGNYTLIEPTGLSANIVGATVVTQSTPTILASNSYIIALNTETTTLLSGGTNTTTAGGTTGGSSTTGSSTNTSGATNNGNVKKLYCN